MFSKCDDDENDDADSEGTNSLDRAHANRHKHNTLEQKDHISSRLLKSVEGWKNVLLSHHPIPWFHQFRSSGLTIPHNQELRRHDGIE